jgi:hypothetical protein
MNFYSSRRAPMPAKRQTLDCFWSLVLHELRHRLDCGIVIDPLYSAVCTALTSFHNLKSAP